MMNALATSLAVAEHDLLAQCKQTMMQFEYMRSLGVPVSSEQWKGYTEMRRRFDSLRSSYARVAQMRLF